MWVQHKLKKFGPDDSYAWQREKKMLQSCTWSLPLLTTNKVKFPSPSETTPPDFALHPRSGNPKISNLFHWEYHLSRRPVSWSRNDRTFNKHHFLTFSCNFRQQQKRHLISAPGVQNMLQLSIINSAQTRSRTHTQLQRSAYDVNMTSSKLQCFPLSVDLGVSHTNRNGMVTFRQLKKSTG